MKSERIMSKTDTKRYKGLRILLICPSNNDYPESIRQVLESEGAKVHYYDERGNPNTLEKVIYRKAPLLLKKKAEAYFAGIIKKEKSFCPNIVLVISPEAITKTAVRHMKRAFKDTRFIVYLWDSMENKSLGDVILEFDECFSFDKRDCNKYGYKFRPLFFSREYYQHTEDTGKADDREKTDYKYDFGFIGTIHSNRPLVINKVRKYCEENSLNYYFFCYVQNRLLLLYWMLKSKDVRELHRLHLVHTKAMPRLETEKKMEQTRCVIDVNHPKQSGLTMRTIEMFGLQRKLATTNKNITKYDFFNPINQIVIDKDKMVLDLELIRKPYVKAAEDVYQKYSIDNWIDEVIGVSKACN